MPRTPSPAAEIAAALASRPEEVCRRYLPQGKKQGRYWVAGDLEGSPGRSLFVRLKPPGVPGKWCDAATGEHGDLLDLIRRRSAASTLRAAMDEARAFLALPAPLLPGEGPPYDAREAARRIWRRCRALDGAPGRGLSPRPGDHAAPLPLPALPPGALPPGVRPASARPRRRRDRPGRRAPRRTPHLDRSRRRPPRPTSPRPARRSAKSSDTPCASAPPTLRSWSGRGSRPCSRS